MISKNRIRIDASRITTDFAPGSLERNAGAASVGSDANGAFTVLLVEDAQLLRKSVSEGLRHQGFQVLTAQDGAEAVEIYRRFKEGIHLVLSDVQMPKLDGPMTLQALRQIDPSVRVCFMTGDVRASVTARLRSQGALEIFSKPLPPLVDLGRRLRELAVVPRDRSEIGAHSPEETLVARGESPKSDETWRGPRLVRRFLAGLISSTGVKSKGSD